MTSMSVTSKVPPPRSSTTAALQLVQAVGHGGGGRLVDDAFDLEPGQLARIPRSAPLALVEVSRDRDHGLRYGNAQGGFRVGLERLQHQRG